MEQTSFLAEATNAKPFLKWAGGKQALVNTLVGYFPNSFNRYYEPFLGGGSVFFALNYPNAVISDYNAWLSDTYKAIKTEWNAVSQILDGLKNEKAEYLRIRAILPSEINRYQKAAHLIYLNKTCFRGLFRVNKKGQFNVPYGEYDRRYYSPENLQQVSIRLKNAEIRQGDFELSLFDISKGDFVYLDPPYYKLGGYSDFNRYTHQQFRENDHLRLAGFCNELDQMGVKWAISNSNTNFIRRIFDGYQVYEIDARREINLNAKSRNVKELLITNY